MRQTARLSMISDDLRLILRGFGLLSCRIELPDRRGRLCAIGGKSETQGVEETGRAAGGVLGCAKGRAKTGTWATVELVVTSTGGPVKAGPKRNTRGTVADGRREAAAESQAWPLAARRSGAVQTPSGGLCEALPCDQDGDRAKCNEPVAGADRIQREPRGASRRARKGR